MKQVCLKWSELPQEAKNVYQESYDVDKGLSAATRLVSITRLDRQGSVFVYDSLGAVYVPDFLAMHPTIKIADSSHSVSSFNHQVANNLGG